MMWHLTISYMYVENVQKVKQNKTKQKTHKVSEWELGKLKK